jgi:hypothetical protein
MSFKGAFIRDFYSPRVTMLGAGPMSLRSTDAIVELANYYKRPIAMIPSRRQVDAGHLGGGYVNNWSTEEFSTYVRAKDAGGYVLLSRDHSGPWQLSKKRNNQPLSHREAMDEVKESLKVDIESGFDLIHIDPSPGLEMGRSSSGVEDDILELLEFCQSIEKRPIDYEIGADEQSQVPDHVLDAEEALQRVLKRVNEVGLRPPIFYVLQTGTKVMETRNIGSFDSPLPVQGMLPSTVQLPEILKMCRRNGVFLKEHNADYLGDEALAWHRRTGIHAANVAPEFGVAETKEILEIAREVKADSFLELFGKTVIENKKWEKWLVKDSTASEEDKIVIAGHYHFSDPALSHEFANLESTAEKHSIRFDERVRDAVSRSIDRYLTSFGYRKAVRQ